MPFALIPFLLLAIPILEIAVFIAVGNLVGLWTTLGLILLTAIVGTLLLRRQGFAILNRIREETRAGRLPGKDLVDGAMILVAGILLLTPGFVSDTLGFLLFVPGVRSAISRFLRERAVVVAGSGLKSFRGAPDPAAGDRRPDFVDLSGAEYSRRPDPTSPWRGSDGKGDGPTLH